MNIYTFAVVFIGSNILTGVATYIGARQHRDKQWKWAILWKPSETSMYVHSIGKNPTLPERVWED